jgi:hypothetical protein
MRKGGQGNSVGRLISAVAALALVFAQLLGAYAHAGHDHAGGHAACAQVDGHGAPADRDGASAPPAGDSEVVSNQGQHDDDRTAHSASCDFLCHGGIAIPATVGFSYLDATPPWVAVVATVAASSPPRSLDRPPRSSVLA